MCAFKTTRRCAGKEKPNAWLDHGFTPSITGAYTKYITPRLLTREKLSRTAEILVILAEATSGTVNAPPTAPDLRTVINRLVLTGRRTFVPSLAMTSLAGLTAGLTAGLRTAGRNRPNRPSPLAILAAVF